MPETRKTSYDDLCFGCGQLNEQGLQLEPTLDNGVAEAEWVPQERFRGYDLLSHGGAVAAVLDEMMGLAVMSMDVPPHATVKLNIEYRQPTWLGKKYRLRGEVVRQRPGALETRAEVICVETGKVTATADAVFVRLMKERIEAFTGRST